MSIEKFEDRILTGKIKVTCKFDDGTIKIWETTKGEVVEHIVEIVNEYAAEGYLLTLRQIHYQFVKSNWIINHDSAYKKLGTVLDDCKYAGIIDWNNIEDRVRVPYIPYSVNGVSGALEDAIETFRIDRQKEQKNVVELWTEKDALSGILKRSTSKYHIHLVVNKGYTSSSAIYQTYQRCIEADNNNQKFTILYFGDHDPSGLDMIRDIRERIQLMLRKGDNVYLQMDNFNIIPIGLTMEQIREYNLPPNPTKITDTRAKSYIKKFGRTCWEVDALSPKTLTNIIEENIRKQIDIELYNQTVKEEKQGKELLKKLINSITQ